MKHLATILLALLLPMAASATPGTPPVQEFDLVVYGGTAGGAVAAIAAADEDLSVALVEPRHHIGGMTSGGLGRTDFGNRSVIGGRSLQFYKRLGDHYGEEISWYFEPHVAERTLRDWLKQAGVALFFGSRLDTVEKDGTTIRAITLLNGTRFEAAAFIDASYEGDLLPRAGITYTWGREGRDVYDESLAGRIEYSPSHQFDVPVDPYDENGELLPLIGEPDGLKPGEGDRKVQAYNFRLCLSSDPENQVPYPKPEGYDPDEWEIMRRYLAARPDLEMNEVMIVSPMPNNKTDINNRGPVSTDYIGASWDYPEASYEEQAQIWKDHERYVKSYLYFLANDPAVPEALQEEVNGYGLAKDEFTDTGHWPHQLYVREARRMVGTYVMRQKDLQDDREKKASIGMGSYNSDSHHVQRFVADDSPLWDAGTPSVLNEGDMQVGVQPYEMSYYAFVPQAKECTNLLVGSTFSASHVAYSSMRMEPQYMIIGEAAGIAAALAILGDTAVQDIDVPALQKKLYEHGAVLHMADAPVLYAHAKDLPGITLDNNDAKVAGTWHTSFTVGRYVGFDYLHESNQADPGNRVRYTPELPADGWYEVRLSYTPHNNRARNARVVVQTAAGKEIITLNQREEPGEHAPFVSLGTYAFKKGSEGYVEIQGHAEADGFVIADAVQWLPKD